MMQVPVALLAGLSICVAHSHDQCSTQQADVVKQQWSATFSDDDIRLMEFARAFFTRYVINNERLNYLRVNVGPSN